MLTPLFLLALASQFSPSHSETIHGAVIFSRHGDRTWKGAPPTALTALGQNQMYDSGTYWRSRYCASDSAYKISGLSEYVYNPTQLIAAAPNQPLLVTSGQAFLQGLYPPASASASETLANGTTLEPPLSGFQYAPLSTVLDDSPETIWLKGDDGCPAHDTSAAGWNSSASFSALLKSTTKFYLAFYPGIFAGVLPAAKMSYANAFTIFDYINVGVIHNRTIAKAVSATDLFHFRTLADSAEYAQNAATSPSDARAVSGRTLAQRILTQFSTIIASQGKKNKLALFIGSYDTFLSFFGLAGLPGVDKDFYGLPVYASALSFELYSSSSTFPAENDLRVRFLFRNGTGANAREFPIFGKSGLKWAEFKEAMEKIALGSVKEWCGFCGSDEAFCKQYQDSGEKGETAAAAGNGGSLHRPAVAGVLGAMVTLCVVAIAGIAAVAAGLRVTRRRRGEGVAVASDKGSVVSE